MVKEGEEKNELGVKGSKREAEEEGRKPRKRWVYIKREKIGEKRKRMDDPLHCLVL